MEICTGQRFESVHPKPRSGAYEWWYFDGWDPRTHSGFVLIFYDGNPFSSRYIKELQSGDQPAAASYPACSLSIYHRGKPVYYAFDEWPSDRVTIQPPDRIQMPGCQCRFQEEAGTWTYQVDMDHRMPNGDSLRGRIALSSVPFDARLDPRVPHAPSSNPAGGHRWNLVQPDAEVNGELSIGGHVPLELNLSGRGYHDHNIGLEPMSATFDTWYWGRFHLPERTLIYYLMEEKGVWDQRAWLISSSDVTELQDGSWSLGDSGINWFGLSTARRLSYEEDGRSLQVHQQTCLDNGPFYQRFASRLLLREGEALTQSEGLCEVILPARIEQLRYRPLVDMRIRYPDRKPHWVQCSPRLYRWTW